MEHTGIRRYTITHQIVVEYHTSMISDRIKIQGSIISDALGWVYGREQSRKHIRTMGINGVWLCNGWWGLPGFDGVEPSMYSLQTAATSQSSAKWGRWCYVGGCGAPLVGIGSTQSPEQQSQNAPNLVNAPRVNLQLSISSVHFCESSGNNCNIIGQPAVTVSLHGGQAVTCS